MSSDAKLLQVQYVNTAEEIFQSEKISPIYINDYERLINLAPKYKNKGFEQEAEVRICFRNFLEPRDEQSKIPDVQIDNTQCKMRFSLTNVSNPKSYYDIPFEYNMIKEIILGPKLNITDYDLKIFMCSVSQELYELIKSGKIIIKNTNLSFR